MATQPRASLVNIIKLDPNDPSHAQEARRDGYPAGVIETIPKTMKPPIGWVYATPAVIERFRKWALRSRSTTT